MRIHSPGGGFTVYIIGCAINGSLLPTYFFQCARAWCSLRAILQVGQFFRDSLSNVIKKIPVQTADGPKKTVLHPPPSRQVWYGSLVLKPALRPGVFLTHIYHIFRRKLGSPAFRPFKQSVP